MTYKDFTSHNSTIVQARYEYEYEEKNKKTSKLIWENVRKVFTNLIKNHSFNKFTQLVVYTNIMRGRSHSKNCYIRENYYQIEDKYVSYCENC